MVYLSVPENNSGVLKLWIPDAVSNGKPIYYKKKSMTKDKELKEFDNIKAIEIPLSKLIQDLPVRDGTVGTDALRTRLLRDKINKLKR